MKFDKCIKKYSSTVDIILGNTKPERDGLYLDTNLTCFY